MSMISDWLFVLIVLMIFIFYKLFSTYPAFGSLLKFLLFFRRNFHFSLTTILVNPCDVLHKLFKEGLCNIFVFRLLSVQPSPRYSRRLCSFPSRESRKSANYNSKIIDAVLKRLCMILYTLKYASQTHSKDRLTH